MNKLVLETKQVLNENLEVLEITKTNTILEIEHDTEIDSILFPEETFETTWIIKKGAKVGIYLAQRIKNLHGKITILSEEDTSLIFHLGLYAEKNNDLVIWNTIQGNHCYSDIKIRIATEENGRVFLKATGDIQKNTKDSTYLEDIKYLNEYPGSIVCLPQLLVESDDTSANHNMTVASIDEETLFYLESRGMNKQDSKEIIRKNFIEAMARKERY